MVRCLAPAICILLAGACFAQDLAVPPTVSTEAPVLGGMEPETGPGLVLPGSGIPSDVANPTVVKGAALAEGADAGNTELLSLITKAHWVVQAVIGLLALAVAAVLTVLLFKSVEFALAFRRLDRAWSALSSGNGLIVVPGDSPLALAATATRDEAAGAPLSLTADLRAAARERLELRLDRIEAGAVMRLRSGTGLLASIGAVGPFVGLFGTVFGIMNSFLAIATANTTNLAVVAPGIAEALLATGIGLIAAIPAVLLYNAIQRWIAAFRHRLADGRADLLLRFSHELDQRMGV